MEQLTAARERDERAREEQQQEVNTDLCRALKHCPYSRRCQECLACRGHESLCTRHTWGVSLASLPCEAWLSRHKYTNRERADVYDLLRERRPDHLYGFASREQLYSYIQEQQDRHCDVHVQ